MLSYFCSFVERFTGKTENMYPSMTVSRVGTITITTAGTIWALRYPSLDPERTRAGVHLAARGAAAVEEEEDGEPHLLPVGEHLIPMLQVEEERLVGEEMDRVHHLEEERLPLGMLRE